MNRQIKINIIRVSDFALIDEGITDDFKLGSFWYKFTENFRIFALKFQSTYFWTWIVNTILFDLSWRRSVYKANLECKIIEPKQMV